MSSFSFNRSGRYFRETWCEQIFVELLDTRNQWIINIGQCMLVVACAGCRKLFILAVFPIPKTNLNKCSQLDFCPNRILAFSTVTDVYRRKFTFGEFQNGIATYLCVLVNTFSSAKSVPQASVLRGLKILRYQLYIYLLLTYFTYTTNFGIYFWNIGKIQLFKNVYVGYVISLLGKILQFLLNNKIVL